MRCQKPSENLQICAVARDWFSPVGIESVKRMATKACEQRSYYEVLRVARTASQSDIKRAFRKLAKMYHPDTNPHNQHRAAKKLKEVITAYRVLSNERERARYDTLMRTSPSFKRAAPAVRPESVLEKAQAVLEDLLDGKGKRGLEAYDELGTQGDFDLARHLDVRDYLDCIFLLAEQCEREGRYIEAAKLYEELLQKGHVHN